MRDTPAPATRRGPKRAVLAGFESLNQRARPSATREPVGRRPGYGKALCLHVMVSL